MINRLIMIIIKSDRKRDFQMKKLNERIDALEGHESYQNTAIANLQESQDVQDGAIEDLGMAVSEIVGEE